MKSLKYIIIALFLAQYGLLSQVLVITTSEKRNSYVLPVPDIEIAVSDEEWCVDDDGNAYRTVRIGNQVWMAENLNVGKMILGKFEQKDNLVIEKYCYNDDPQNCLLYGGLYQWPEMMKYGIAPTRGICPKGWHVPEDSEWKILEMAIGMSENDANDIEYRGTIEADLLRVDGGTGFDALLGGGRDVGGQFIYQGIHGYYWTGTENILTHAWGRYFVDGFSQLYRSRDNREHGFSVRCVKD